MTTRSAKPRQSVNGQGVNERRDANASAPTATSPYTRPLRRLGALVAVGAARVGAWNLALFLGALAVYLVVGAVEIVNIRLDGDEPWYVMLGYSIVHNHTVDLAAIVRDPRLYASFTSHWDDHTKDFLGDGERLLPNLPGYSAIIGIGYALGNRVGILVLQAVATAITVTLLFQEGRRLFSSRAAGLFAALAFVFALPALLYVGQAFPSALASFVTFAGFVLAMRTLPAAQGRRLVAASLALGTACALAPWLHFKYAPAALALLALGLASLWPRLGWPPRRAASAAARESWRATLLVAGIPLLSFALIGLYSRHYFGTWTPQYATAAGSGMDVAHPNLARAAGLYADMFLSAQSGLLPWVPLDALVPIGLVLLWRRDRRVAGAILLCVAAQLGGFLPALFTPAVYQGYALPARFTIECAPFFALCVAAVFAAGWPALRAWMARFMALSVTRLGLAQGNERGAWLASRRLVHALAPLAAAGALALLLVGAWFSAVGAHDPGELYGNSGGVRIAEKYAQVVPAWWFGLFPDPSHQAQYTQTLDLTTETAPATSYGWPGARSLVSHYYLPPGQYIATFTWACSTSASSPDTSASSPDTQLALVVERGGAARAPLLQRRLTADQCTGGFQTLALGPFSSLGYISTGFRVVYGSDVTLTSATATYRPARA